MTREIPLTQGAVALVDDADFEWLSQWNWHRAGRYAARTIKRQGVCSKVWMHRVIFDGDAESLVDHKNGDGLDNQRSNLRAASHWDNARNRRTPNGNSTGYRGVYANRNASTYRAHLTVDGLFLHVGSFRSPVAAARAYDAAAAEHFGEFSVPNFGADRDWLFPHEHVGTWPPVPAD